MGVVSAIVCITDFSCVIFVQEVNEAESASPQDKRLVDILETKRRLAESRRVSESKTNFIN